MNTAVETLNTAGRAFVDFVLPMLIQSSVLILILLIVDAVLRRRVRAVFRYWIWMLVLVKLVLPPSLGSPVSLGTWFGDTLEVPAVSLLEPEPPQLAEPQATGLPSTISAIFSPPDPAIAQPLMPPPAKVEYPQDNAMPVETPEPNPLVQTPTASLNWQGLTLLTWAVVVFALTLLLVQRAFFVRGLVGQSGEVSGSMLDELEHCRQRLGLRGRLSLRLSPNATSPAVCGLFRPVVLIPQTLAPKLRSHDLRAVFLHELAHIKRGDLWGNLIQTLLQIAYFYNPLLWLANAMIRRTREQAVDETVLVAMGETASQYPETLVNIAKLAFAPRPALSLRLIGVVESKSALTARIRHILNRPLPKTAKLGGIGLLTLFVLAAVLLPMAKARRGDDAMSRLAVLPNCGVWLSDINGQDLSVLDFASERIIVLAAVQKERDLLRMTGPQGQGDVLYYYDNEKGRPKITFLGSAGLNGKPVSDEYEMVTITPMQMPFETTVTTRSGGRFRISIVRADEQACSIRFHPLGRAPLAFKAILPDNRTIELLGVSEYPSEGRRWWRPDGKTLTEVPCTRDRGDKVSPSSDERACEFCIHVNDLPKGAQTTIEIQSSHSLVGGGSPVLKDGKYRDDLRWCAAVLPGDKESCAVRCGVAAGPWETIAQTTGQGAGSQGTALGGVSFSPAFENTDEGVVITATDDILDRPSRVVAVTADGRILTPVRSQTSSAGKARQMTAYFRGLSLSQIGEFRFQTRPWTWVEFRNVSLRPGRSTDVEVQAQVDEGQAKQARVVLPDVDHEAMMLDLATGRLVPIPQVEPEARLLEAIRELGRGDLVLDGRSLLLVRGAESEQSEEGPMELLRAIRIRRPPAACTVTTAEGRQYRIKVLSMDDKACTLTYSPISLDRDAGGGALVEPENAGGVLELRIAPILSELAPGVVEEYRKSLIEGRTPPDSRYLWFPVRPGYNPPGAITEMHAGKFWLLVHNTEPFIMVPSQGWEIANVSRGTDQSGRPMIRLEFDSAGAERMLQLTKANDNHPLAMIINGVVVSAPNITSGGTGFRQALILGSFTEQEVEDLLAALSNGTSEIVLPEADQQSVLLDLATGELVPLPPVGPEPQKTQQALRELGKGDILYGVDLGDRALLLLRDATSEQAREDTGEPGIAGYDIGPSLPQTLTVTTAEGRRYEVTILAADKQNCTLRYSSLPLDRGAGGGAPVESEKADGMLEFRIVPNVYELPAGVVEEYKTALLRGRTSTDGRYLWISVRAGTNPPPHGITQIHEGRLWLLLWNEPSHALLAGEDWGIKRVYETKTTDATGRPIVGLVFDEKGAELFYRLTQANVMKSMAIVLDREVLSAPMIVTPIREQPLIVGNFTAEEVRQIVTVLEEGMVKRQETRSPPVGAAEEVQEPGTGAEVSGRVLDPNGKPVAGAQVALITTTASVTIYGGRLLPPRFGRVEKAPIVETDAQGRFRFESEPNEGFSLVAAQDAGFALVDSEAFAAGGVLRLEKWGRVEGQVAEGSGSRGDQVLMDALPNSTWREHKYECRYEGYCDAQGRFAFSRVPAGWFEAGYMTRTGDSVSSFTSRTPIVVKSGETTRVKLGGEGRPVIGRFVPPEGYGGTVYFGAGLRSLATWRPEFPKPDDYDQMTKRRQQEWYEQWRKTPEARTFYDAIWHDLNRRHYTFRINRDGTFRIEDVIAGKYTMTVYLEREPWDQGPPQEDLGGYRGTVEVPPIPGGRSDEPLDLGELVLRMNEQPLKVGETAPLFEAKALDGKEVRLAKYRGKFVLLSFWQPVSNPELDRLKELHKTYGTGRLQIIGLGGNDTRDEVESFVREHKIEWPEIYFGPDWDAPLLKQLGGQMQILLIDPAGKIVATWLRGEKLAETVRDAIAADVAQRTESTVEEIPEKAADPVGRVASRENLYAVARSANYKVGPEWFQAAESSDDRVYEIVQTYAERYGEPGFHQVLDDWARWKYRLDTRVDTDSAMALFQEFCDQFDEEREFYAWADPRIRAIGLIGDKLDAEELMDRYVRALRTRESFYSSCSAGVDLSIDDPRFTGHDGDVLPASLSAVWYALRRIDEKLDDRNPSGQNVIEDKLTPILIREYKRQKNPSLLDRAVLLGGRAISEFLLEQDWQDIADDRNRETVAGYSRFINKWLLRLINLDDPAGERFRKDHPEFVSLLADAWAERPGLSFDFQPPRLLLLDKDAGTDSFAWRYWPTYVKKTEAIGFRPKRLEREFNYLAMLEPHATTQMYLDCWIRAIDESGGGFWNPRQILQNVPAPRKQPLATLLVRAIEERLRKTGTWNEQDRVIESGLESDRMALKEFLDETSG